MRIRELGERLDAHRKERQSLHPRLTLTGMYNVLEAMRSRRALTAKEQSIHAQGLVTVLEDIHRELDCAVADAYGWPVDLSDGDTLTRLVALNGERVREEQEGYVRWLRPEYQTQTKDERQRQSALHLSDPLTRSPTGPETDAKELRADTKLPWPTEALDQTQSVRSAIEVLRKGNLTITTDRVCARFTRPSKKRIEEILLALRTLGLDTLP